ncbi:MAG: sulfite exporter TauE/SafE family protein [Cytophagaceae bacterium]
MFFITAIVFGLLSSFHCVGMCGPIALALPVIPNTSNWITVLIYNTGRVVTYSMMGAAMGMIGYSLQWWGAQRYLSIIAGVGIVLFTLWYWLAKSSMGSGFVWVSFLKKKFQYFIQQKSLSGIFALGIINGWLPCGVVYLALSASIMMGSIGGSAVYMAGFGLGTIPMMAALSYVRQASFWKRWSLHKWIPVYSLTLGMLLCVRGMSLGIPYLSPEVKENKVNCCHPSTASTTAAPSCH